MSLAAGLSWGSALRDERTLLDQLATMVRSGIPIRDALRSMKGLPARRASRVAAGLLERVERGATLSEAMAALPRTFPQVHRAVVAAGERCGALPATLTRLRDEVDRRIAAAQALFTKSAYPLAILALTSLLTPLFLIFEGRTGSYLAIELLVFGSAAGLWALAFHERRRLWRLLQRLPFLGTALKRSSLGRSLSLLGLLVQAGIGVREALELAASAAGESELAEELRGSARALDRGKNLAEALSGLSGLPPDEWGMIATGEQAGAMDKALEESGLRLEESGRRRVGAVLAILPVAIYIVAGLVVFFVYFQAMLRSTGDFGL
jgi:general secretion pathway protein F